MISQRLSKFIMTYNIDNQLVIETISHQYLPDVRQVPAQKQLKILRGIGQRPDEYSESAFVF